MGTLRQVCTMGWLSLGRSSGLRPKSIDDSSLKFNRPQWLSADKKISEIRFSKKGRIFYYRDSDTMNIFRFDPEHKGTGQ